MAKAIIKDLNKSKDDLASLGDLELNDEVKARLVITSDDKFQKEKKKDALKGIKKLLHISERYATFCKDRIDPVFQQSEQERVDNMLKQQKSAKSIDNIPYFTGKLMDYQLTGVNWLKTLFEHGVNGILGDEMGLGKTIQVIALMCHLIDQIDGPFLIVVPLSTLPNWKSEFKKFAPQLPVVIFHGSKNDRPALFHDILKKYKFNNMLARPIVITTPNMVASELKLLTKISWQYLIVDEGHCIKNWKSQISRNMRAIPSLNKLILTGTPLQNNLTELWCILNFIMPNIFKNIDAFSSLFALEDFEDNNKIVNEEKTTNIISSLHKILQPFMLRRLKSEVLDNLVPKKEMLVYCPLSKLQRTLYMYTIKANLAGLAGEEENEDEDWTDKPRPKRKCALNRNYVEPDIGSSFEEEIIKAEKILGEKVDKNEAAFINNSTMQSPLTMFRKIVNHPYLVHTPVTPDRKHIIVDERLVTESGKMLVLDAMLPKLKLRNHKVIIFSTLTMVLDMIEEFMIMRNHTYRRLDGRMAISIREEAVNAFNGDPNIFCFLISTRAGGLGINLTAADTVILYDRDWNPQVDIQAQARCHRIGQTKPVMIYSLITKNTVDDKIVNAGNMKRKLEKVVMKTGTFANPTKSAANEDLDLEYLLAKLEKDDSTLTIQNSHIFSDKEWEQLLDRSDLYKEMKNKQKMIDKRKMSSNRKMDEDKENEM